MRRTAAALRALPVTFVVYMLEAGLALLMALPLGLELLDDGRASLSTSVGRAVSLDRAVSLLPALHVQATASLLHLGLLLLLAPWLQMAWLHALARPSSVGRALAQGAHLYLRAWLVTLWVAVLAALASAPFLVAASLVERMLADGDARLHDALLAGVCLPLVLVLWLAHVLHDLGRARALSHGAWASLRGSLGMAFRLRAQLPALLFAGLGSAAHAAAWLLIARGTFGSSIPSVALLQLACLLGLFARSGWLACALACTDSERTSGDHHD